MISQYELEVAVAGNDLRTIAAYVADAALQSARENGARPGADEREAAETLDEWDRIHNISGCGAVCILADKDMKLVAGLAIAIIEGRA